MSAATGTGVDEGATDSDAFALVAPGTSREVAGADVAGGELPGAAAAGDVPHAAADATASTTPAKATKRRIGLFNARP